MFNSIILLITVLYINVLMYFFVFDFLLKKKEIIIKNIDKFINEKEFILGVVIFNTIISVFLTLIAF